MRSNAFMVELLHGDADVIRPSEFVREPMAEEAQGLPEGQYLHELADAGSGEPIAMLDLAWPDGLQEVLSEPIAVLLNEGPEVLAC